MEPDIFRAVEQNGKIEVVVDVRFARSLYEHLRNKGISVTPLGDATFVETSYRYEYGRLIHSAIVRDKEFQVQASLYEFEDSLGDWIPSAEELPPPQLV